MKTLTLGIWLALLLAVGVLADPPQTAPASTLPLLNTLVNNSLKLADEDDPLKRAGYCSDVADQLARSLTQASARQDRVMATRLAGYLDQVWRHGVGGNVARISFDLPDPKRDREVQALKQRAERINRDLKTQMRDDPPVMLPLPPGIRLPGGDEDEPR